MDEDEAELEPGEVRELMREIQEHVEVVRHSLLEAAELLPRESLLRGRLDAVRVRQLTPALEQLQALLAPAPGDTAA